MTDPMVDPAPAGAVSATEADVSDVGGYTAVVYVHGMGEQRRYEEVSNLVDALDGYAHWSSHEADQPVGTLQKIRARLEPPRGPQERDVSYVRVYYSPPGASTPKDMRPVRFYEVYWAPVTAGGQSWSAVTRWLLRQVRTPLAVLRSPWRERQRQRRASLHSLWEEMRVHGYGDFRATDFAHLLNSYNHFERADSRRMFPDGTFRDFHRFLDWRNSRHPDRLQVLHKLADVWHRRYVRSELFTLVVLLSLSLVLALAVGGSLMLVSAVAGILVDLMPGADTLAASTPVGKLAAWGAEQGRAHALEVTLGLLSAAGVARFLRDYLGDVQIWSTYQETEVNYKKRREILDNAVHMLRHVLEDPLCRRVVVVAHSLGTAIAVDALLDLGRHNRARNASAPMLGPLELEKLDQVVTFGSPIDKIHYFFESRTGSCHRYNRVVEEVRGDIGGVPFTKNRKPHVHWVNFWDVGDVVSGALETPSNPRDPWLRVDNVRVQSYLFPDPGASHSAYLKHRDVIGRLFAIIFEGSHSLRGFSSTAKDQSALEKSFLGPGAGSSMPRLVQSAALVVPWLLLAGVGAYAFGAPSRLAAPFIWVAVLLVVGLALGWAGGKARGHLAPLQKQVSGESDEE